MGETASDAGRDAAYFVLGPGALTVLCAVLWRIHPWPVPLPAQAAVLDWRLLLPFLAFGCAGVWVSSRVGCPSAPHLGERRQWARLALWSAELGAAFGIEGLVQSLIPWVAQQQSVIAGGSGLPNIQSWVNVGLPWSIPHYFAASVALECLFRLGPIPILTWLIGRIAPARWSRGTIFWIIALLASAQEPLLWGLGILRSPLPLAAGVFAGFSVSLTLATNLVEAYGLRRWGWPSPILFRLGFYAAARVFLPYVLPAHSVLYPGPH